MKANKIRTVWIMLLSLIITAKIAFAAVFMKWFGRINREWVNKTIQRWSSDLLNLAGVRYEIINPHNTKLIPGRATIVMCNHSSLYDIPLSLKAFPSNTVRMLGKVELSKIPVLGSAMHAAEFPFINRHNRHQAIKDLEIVQQLLESGVIMWIAPEGTRSKTGKLGALKKGGFITAIQTQANIIPIAVRGAQDILPAHSLQLNLNQNAEIHIGPMVDASEYTLADKEKLIKKVYDIMKELVEGSESSLVH